jgi:hypothetical protein
MRRVDARRCGSAIIAFAENSGSKVIAMLEFTSRPQKAVRPLTLFISLGVLAVLLGAVFLYVNYQKNNRQGSSAVVVPGLVRPGDPDFEYYKTRIRIENVKATLAKSFSNARFATISGTIVNDGDRNLEALELHITLYDVFGEISKERTAFALRPGSGYVSRPMEPLEERPFVIGIESIEYYWDPKQISYEITGLKYK